MIDHGIDENGNITFAHCEDSLCNNVWISINLRRGFFFQNKKLGSRLFTIKKLTPDTIRLAQDYCKEALQWLLDIGRVSSINIVAERDVDDKNRLNLAISLVRANDEPITYNLFYRVI